MRAMKQTTGLTRPKTRTERMDDVTAEAIRDQFGTFVHAHEKLMPNNVPLRYRPFYLVVTRQPVTPAHLGLVISTWRAWKALHVK